MYNLRKRAKGGAGANTKISNDENNKLNEPIINEEELRTQKSNKGKRKQENSNESQEVVNEGNLQSNISSSSSMVTRSKKRALIVAWNINTLPSEVLAHIFTFLIHEEENNNNNEQIQRWNNLSENLIIASRVCTHWYNNIVNLPFWSSFSLFIQPLNLTLSEKRNIKPFFKQPCFANILEVVIHGIDTQVLNALPNWEKFKSTSGWKKILKQNKSTKQVKYYLKENQTKILKFDLSEEIELEDYETIELTTVVLSRKINAKTSFALNHISKLTNLLELTLKGDWSGVDATPLSKLVNLSELDVNSTRLTLTPESITTLRKLEILSFGDLESEFTFPLWSVIQALPLLDNLAVIFSSFSRDFDFNHFGAIRTLESFGVFSGQTPFQTIFDFLRPQLPNLDGLGIGAEDLTKEKIGSMLQQCPRLSSLITIEGEMTDNEREELKQQFPRVNFSQ
eukprot:TRINITY_DN1049_c0_g1_i6.p1 TRINITY_DN1049_c0_g1~~TRINITY_DN1049_c0_g1_i6.p1  ORF type:complete len:453 (-),score=92.68 TRINITY_DN1049_c0_g1_i6:253-1611(-)